MAKVSHKSWASLALLCIGKEQTSVAALWGAKFWSKKRGANEVFICTFRLALESDDPWKKYTTCVTKNKTHKKRLFERLQSFLKHLSVVKYYFFIIQLVCFTFRPFLNAANQPGITIQSQDLYQLAHYLQVCLSVGHRLFSSFSPALNLIHTLCVHLGHSGTCYKIKPF